MSISFETPAESSSTVLQENAFPGAQGYEVLSKDNKGLFCLGSIIVPVRYENATNTWIVCKEDALVITRVELRRLGFFESYLTLMERYPDVVYCFDKSFEN